VFRQIYENVIGFSPAIVLNRGGVSDTVLRDYGDLTIQLLCMFRTAPSGAYVIAFQASGETEPTNYSWSVQVSSANTMGYFAEFGAGGDTSYITPVSQRGLPGLGVLFKLDMVRKAVTGGVTIQFYVNGIPFGPPSGILTAPTGGTTSQLVLTQTGASVELAGVEIDNAVLTDGQIVEAYNRTLGGHFGELVPEVKSLWVGALTNEGATIVVGLTYASDDVSVVVTGSNGFITPSAAVAYGSVIKFVIDDLDEDTEYTYQVKCNGNVLEIGGKFKTLKTNPATFTVAFSGDSITNSNALVFDTIREANPLMFIHMGDLHYHNFTTNEQTQFHAAFDEVFAQPRPAQLYRDIPTAYGWDDHDYGNNNSNASPPTKPAANAVYRQRVPHYPLPDTTAVYQTWDIGRVRFILTDQRSGANADSATDNSSKTMLGTAQKTWFKNLLSNSVGYFIVWICPRWFGTAPTAGADSWGGFSTERIELVTHIHNNCPGRVAVLSADVHGWGVDDGSHHDFLPGGGEPLPCFQASPLDIAAPGMAGTYSAGSGAVNGVYGTMTVDDAGGSSVDVTWKLYDSSAAQLSTTLTFTVNL